MSDSTENNLLWLLIIGTSFLLAVGVVTLCPAMVATNEPLLHAWRFIMGMLAIVFIKQLVDVLPHPRVRAVSLQNL
jgi:hypothetical protein